MNPRSRLGWWVGALLSYGVGGWPAPARAGVSLPRSETAWPPSITCQPYLLNQQPLRVALAERVAEVRVRGPGQVEGWSDNGPRALLSRSPSASPEMVIQARAQETPSQEVGYRLVVGRYPTRSEADREAAKIRQRGLPAYVAPGQEGLAVQVEGLRDAAWAHTLQQRVTAAGYPDCRVETYALPRRRFHLTVRLEGAEVPTTHLSGVKITPPEGQPLAVQSRPLLDRSYRGALVVQLNPAAGLEVLNEVRLDDYLRGVLPLEMGPSFAPEALKAQAVAARTYALAQLLGREGKGGYHFTVQNTQAYGGVEVETARTDTGVAATQGELLTFQGRLVNTVFHTVCGGQTEDVVHVWGRDDSCLRGVRDGPRPAGDLSSSQGLSLFLRSRSDSYCSNHPSYRWSVSFSRAQAQSLLDRTLREVLKRTDVSLGPLQDLRIEERSPNGRVQTLAVVGGNHTYRVRRDAIRWLFGTGRPGPSGLKSTLFLIQREADGSRYAFSGGGWGHGAGLCQMGAQGLARAGRTYEEILLHYYRGAVLTRVQ